MWSARDQGQPPCNPIISGIGSQWLSTVCFAYRPKVSFRSERHKQNYQCKNCTSASNHLSHQVSCLINLFIFCLAMFLCSNDPKPTRSSKMEPTRYWKARPCHNSRRAVNSLGPRWRSLCQDCNPWTWNYLRAPGWNHLDPRVCTRNSPGHQRKCRRKEKSAAKRDLVTCTEDASEKPTLQLLNALSTALRRLRITWQGVVPDAPWSDIYFLNHPNVGHTCLYMPIYAYMEAYMEHQGVVADLNLRRNEGVNQLHLHKEGSIAWR